jgi:signal transduction histidine kinase
VRSAAREVSGRGAADASSSRVPLLLALVVVLALLDLVVPRGIAFGGFLVVPVLLASASPTRRDVLLVGGASLVCKAAETVLGGAPVIPMRFWIPNLVLVYLAITMSIALALLLQEKRLAVERARDEAVSARELNRLLMALLAHDLRAPLVVARQCISYVEDTLANGATPDPGLLVDTTNRLDRSLRAIEIVLSVARRDAADEPEARDTLTVAHVADVIRAELESFRGEAEVQGKRIVADLDGLTGAEISVNLLVLRQALAILVDNAIRYARPGDVVVSAAVRDGMLGLSVMDEGPAAAGAGGALPHGAGLGLELSRALVLHAGGTLDRGSVDGEAPWTIRLPVRRPG